MQTNLTARRLLLITAMAWSIHAPAQAQQTPASPAEYKAQSPKLDRARVDELLAHPDQLLFIDVRRPDELTSNGGFPAYLSIQAGDLEKYLAFIPRDRTIVTVSNHAARASKAADLLAAHGFKVAGAIGVLDYQAQGGTLLKVAAPAPKSESPTAAAH